MRGVAAFARVTVSCALLACGIGACGLDASGTSAEAGGTERDASTPFIDSSVTGAGANGDIDANGGAASSSSSSSSSGGGNGAHPFDGGNLDPTSDSGAGAGDIPDSAVADACPLPVTNTGGIANASRPATSPIIDGDLGEWSCADWVSLTEGDAMYAKDGGPPVAALFAAEYDEAHLYFAYHVLDSAIAGDSLIDPYVNDSIELYLTGDPSPNGAYDNGSHHYVIDHNNLTVDYGPPYETPSLPQLQSPLNITSAVKVVTGGYDVEVSVVTVALGVTSFSAGQTIFFDAEVNAGNGITQNSIALWALGKHGTCACTNLNCCCGAATGDFPFCDTSRFGALVLQ